MLDNPEHVLARLAFALSKAIHVQSFYIVDAACHNKKEPYIKGSYG